jgi:hypothetical protein
VIVPDVDVLCGTSTATHGAAALLGGAWFTGLTIVGGEDADAVGIACRAAAASKITSDTAIVAATTT